MLSNLFPRFFVFKISKFVVIFSTNQRIYILRASQLVYSLQASKEIYAGSFARKPHTETCRYFFNTTKYFSTRISFVTVI